MATARTKTAAPNVPEVALSVCQPWAWAIAQGHKSVENRTWATRYRGPIAIHASSSKRHLSTENECFLIDAGDHIYREMDDPRYTPGNPLFYFSAIVGVAEVVGCVEVPNPLKFDQAVEAAGFGKWLRDKSHRVPPSYWAQGTQCWLLTNPVQFTEPISCKGALNLWKLTPELQTAIKRELRRTPRLLPVDYVDAQQKAERRTKARA
jgi:hypothetical protein